VIELEPLYRRLDAATFTQRAQIAAEVAAAAAPAELDALVRGLGHPHPSVRLGVIEILRQARHRGALAALLAHARAHDGDDRVFALRALADLATAHDGFLGDAARSWLGAADPFVAAQAARIAAAVTAPTADAPASAAERVKRLVVAAFAASSTTERLARLGELEAMGPPAVAAAAPLLLKKGGPDLVALIARALIRGAAALPAPAALVPHLDDARRRVGDAPAASAALDDALVALAGPASPVLLARLDGLDEAQVDALVGRLRALPATDAALAVPALVEVLARVPALWASVGPALVHAAPHVRTGARADLRQAAERVVDGLRAGEEVPAATTLAAAGVLAHVAEPGQPLPAQLAQALERLAEPDAAQALAALCGRLASEEAAARLIAMARDPLPAARAAATAALAAWTSPWVDVTAEPAIVPRYRDGDDRPLLRRGRRLVSAGGDDFVLDERGQPVRAAATEHGGCLCCAPPRALIHPRRARLRCPATWEAYLRDGERVVREADTPLGGCRRCDSLRPRVQDGRRAICLDCGAGLVPTDEPPELTGPSPLVPSEHGRQRDALALPRPPAPADLAEVAAPIRAAIAANVFLRGRDGGQLWSGSGIVVARAGDHVAVLTNRHVVEDERSHRLASLSAMTVAGELTDVRVVWRAARGVDLALVEGRIADGVALATMPLAAAPVPIGARVFAIGNPLGLAWTYSAGTLSASRQWKTQDGLAVRVLQTDTNIAPGSSGGGLFHEDGRLLGVISFGHQGQTGGAMHFALAIDSVRETLVRESVAWRGSALIATH
jgi:hypothetical protein